MNITPTGIGTRLSEPLSVILPASKFTACGIPKRLRYWADSTCLNFIDCTGTNVSTWYGREPVFDIGLRTSWCLKKMSPTRGKCRKNPLFVWVKTACWYSSDSNEMWHKVGPSGVRGHLAHVKRQGINLVYQHRKSHKEDVPCTARWI